MRKRYFSLGVSTVISMSGFIGLIKIRLDKKKAAAGVFVNLRRTFCIIDLSMSLKKLYTYRLQVGFYVGRAASAGR